jgi:predicted ABC-type ATPase
MPPAKRFRLIAGPNGSGKTTLMRQLRDDYAVNFYTVLNADDIFASVSRTGAYLSPFPIAGESMTAYAKASSYDDSVKEPFMDGKIKVDADCVRFLDPSAINSYTIALLTNYLQDEHIERGLSFSQETVFSHPSKIDALRKAFEKGYRTYLYFVATTTSEINVSRVANRLRCGGHDVPAEKIRSRFERSIRQVRLAFPFLSRAYFFDNSEDEMRYLAGWTAGEGFDIQSVSRDLPNWFLNVRDVDSMPEQRGN